MILSLSEKGIHSKVSEFAPILNHFHEMKCAGNALFNIFRELECLIWSFVGRVAVSGTV